MTGARISTRNEINQSTDTQSNKYRKMLARPKERPKERKARYCDAPNWNPNHKCPA